MKCRIVLVVMLAMTYETLFSVDNDNGIAPYFVIDEHRIFEVNPITAGAHLIFEDSTMRISKYHSFHMQLSHSGKYFCFSGNIDNATIYGCADSSRYLDAVIILNRQTNEKQVVCQYNRGRWAPYGDAIVLLNWVDFDEWYKTSNEACIYNPDNGEKKRIFEGNALFEGVCWANHDGKIYVDAYSDMVYDPDTGLEESIRFQGSEISPDGLYSFSNMVEDLHCFLYKFPDNRIPLVPTDSKERSLGVLGFFVSWQELGNRSVVYIVENFRLYYIDCQTGIMQEAKPPAEDIESFGDLVGFRDGRPVWAKITGDKAELFYY